MKKIPQMFRTTDGTEFECEQDAERHQAVVDAKSAYDAAKQSFEFALAECAKTGDGKPFTFDRWRYWYVVRYFGFPDIRSVSLSRWNFEITEIEEDDMSIRVDVSTDHSKPHHVNFRISDLYTTEESAKKVLLDAQEEQLAEYRKQVKTLRASVKKERPTGGEGA